MIVVRVFNNNVVLARDEDGTDAVLTGRGLGFQAKPGTVVDPAKVVRVFRPEHGRDPDQLAHLVAGIPPEQVHLVALALADIGMGASVSPALLIALADHVSFAQRRLAMKMTVEYPLLAEVRHLYGEEYSRALGLLEALNARLTTPLPETEAVALALHLVNAGFTTGDLGYTYRMTGVIQQMVSMLQSAYALPQDQESVSLGRFVTHLRYLFVRVHSGKQLDDRHSPVGQAIRQAHPEALAVARRLAAIVELRLEARLTEDELSYLTLHVARVAADAL